MLQSHTHLDPSSTSPCSLLSWARPCHSSFRRSSSGVSARACLSCRFCVGWTLAFVFEPTLLMGTLDCMEDNNITQLPICKRTTAGFSSGPCTCRPYTTSKGRRQIGGGPCPLGLSWTRKDVYDTTLSRNEKRERESYNLRVPLSLIDLIYSGPPGSSWYFWMISHSGSSTKCSVSFDSESLS